MISPGARTVIVAAALLLPSAPRLWASGSDYARSTKDLSVTVDSQWAGGQYGGYAPIRIRVRNTGKPQELLFRFSPDAYANLPRVEQSVTVGQNETRQFTLAVPMVGESQHAYVGGRMQVLRNGRVIEELSDTISLPEEGIHNANCPSLLVVSTPKVDCEQFSLAANSIASSKGLAGSHGGYSPSEDHAVVDPVMLPQSAVDYSGLDILAIPWETLKTIPEGARSAIVNWVRTGGKLLVYETKVPGADLPEFRGLLQLPSGESWQHAPLDARRPMQVITDEMRGGVLVENEGGWGTMSGDYEWPNGPNAFAIHPQMLGQVIAMPENPFPGTPHDWAWLLNSLKPDTWRWTTRQGLTTRQPDSAFTEFAIPGVGGVPKIAFIVLISGFTIVIGPLNYFLLKRRQQLYLLVVTIPAIAFFTSCALFAYAAVSDGFGVTSRTRSFTLLDQRTKTAVALGRTALYAGIAPSNGLQFSSETAVFPIWAPGQDSPQGTVDWTNGQHFLSGWIRSRTPAQFLTVTSRTERGRLEISAAGTDQVDVANGLAWNINLLVVVDDDGNTFLGKNVAAGGSARLTLTPADEVVDVLEEQYKAHPLEIYPGGAAPTTPPTPSVVMSGAIYYGGPNLNVSYSGGNLESNLTRLLKPKNDRDLTDQRRSYIAILRENPGLELGVESTDAEGDFHVLHGRY